MTRFFIIIILWSWISVTGNASDIIMRNKAGTTLNPVQLFKDSTYEYPTGKSFRAGRLFEVIGETKFEYEDDSQNQKFKWYQVITPAGETGWIYGDALAIMVKELSVPQHLTQFHKQKFSFDNGFENATIWVAAINGRDNFHKQDYLNPPYAEKYLVITNHNNRSVHMNIGGLNARGTYELASATLTDATGDGVSDFVLQINSRMIGKAIENRNLVIHSFQAGNLKKIFEESLNLTYGNDLPSPALYKHVEISDKTIRIAYPDYIDCENYQQPYTTQAISADMERCLEYVTYTFQWNEGLDLYQPIYELSRTPILAKIKYVGITLLEKPDIFSRRYKKLAPNANLIVIKHHERKAKTGQQKHMLTYFLVQAPTGEQGYILADKLNFQETEHASLLERYYSNPPASKAKWTSSQSFVVIRSLRDTSVSHK